MLWPRRGWSRSARYVGHRLGRLPGTPYRIAAGFAAGAAISFTPFIGFHFVGGAMLALVLRGNILASAIGTAVGNPWTFPFIWAWIYALGRWILGADWGSGKLSGALSMSYIFEHFWEVFIPMMVGGVPTAIVAWFAFFWPAQRVVKGYQRARRKRLFGRARRARRKARAEAAKAQARQAQGTGAHAME